ncbi:hypothetical protein K3495_g7713 [Podosphaera aphanis]|nr:hypothetical protein K3495_g7713 [Podosphaera aphanis]
MAPSTRSSVPKEDPETSRDPNQELTISEILAEIRLIGSQQAKQSRELSALNDRIDNLEATVNGSAKAEANTSNDSPCKELKDREKSTKWKFEQTDHPARDPFKIPGLHSTWNPARGLFVAPAKSPGLRGKTNLLNLSDPHIDREGCKTWPTFNANGEYI